MPNLSPDDLWQLTVRDRDAWSVVTLFTALSYLDGNIFGQTAAKHTYRQGLDFPKCLDREMSADPQQPHQIVNTFGGELAYLVLSTHVATDIVPYPDSDK